MAKVLVVDDEPDILLLARLTLQMAGHEVLEATDGTAALELIDNEDIELVLLDLRMEPVDGWEVLDRLRSSSDKRTIPVIVISAHASPETADKVIASGGSGYLSKPFETSELLESVDSVLKDR